MSDWQVGDLALCVRLPERDPECEGLWRVSVGGVYTVLEIARDALGQVLNFREDPDLRHDAGFDADCFRKIRPDEHEACEPEFITLLKRAKRPVSA